MAGDIGTLDFGGEKRDIEVQYRLNEESEVQSRTKYNIAKTSNWDSVKMGPLTRGPHFTFLIVLVIILWWRVD